MKIRFTVGLTNIANLLKTERIDAHLYDELQQLKRENTRLRQERDFRTRRIGRLMAELGLACKVKRTTKRPQIRNMIYRLPKII